MGLGFRLNLKLGFPFHSHSFCNSPSRLSSSSASSSYSSSSYVKGREASINHTRLSFLSVISEEGDIAFAGRDPFKTCAYSSALPIIDNEHVQVGGLKVDIGKMSHHGIKVEDLTNSKERTSRYGLLLENLSILEASFADSDTLKLERDILQQLGRLGALKLFNECLTRTLETTYVFDTSGEKIGEFRVKDTPNDHVTQVLIRTTKKEERKSRRERASAKNARKSAASALRSKSIRSATFSSVKKVSNSKSRRSMIARNEAEMARGVKAVADLEKLRTILEEETGRVVSLNCWAEAAGLEVKVLKQQLSFGWFCRDELIKSTRSLVLFFARNYRGVGIALEDLLQAGNLGVLQGAERFDHTKGYRFSTYVQYWIRKSMSKIVSRLARGIQIPCTLSRAINQIQRARKALSTSQGKYPDDNEIAKFTGLSLAKIESASRCLRVVGSVDQKMGESLNAKYLEFVPDMSVRSPEEVVNRQHMIQDVNDVIKGLDTRERQVLILRFGLYDYRPKSLEEIGKSFHVSKEWVRRLEKRVLTRLRSEETSRDLRHYIHS